jgi:RND family efflux transporter MFP subunit
VSLLQAQSEKTQAESQLVTAEYNYTLELGQQSVARYQWEMLENKETATPLEKELTLRQPHLRKAEADVASAKAGVAVAEQKIQTAKTGVDTARAALRDAEAALEQARLDLARTEVRVPFTALVLDRTASLGAQVTTQTRLASLVDAEVFWVQLAVPLDRVPWIRVRSDQQPGASVALRPTGAMSDGAEWTGEVVRRLPAIEEQGRQAQFLVEVRNPLTAGNLPLLLGAFVQAEIEGPERTDVFVIPRTALREGKQVWLRNAENRLEVVPVAIEWSDADTVLVRDSLEEGTMLVTSDIASPVPGMKLALPGEAKAAQKEAAAAPPAPKME